MMKSILAAVDGSPESLEAMREAVDWAKQFKAVLRGIYVEDERRLVTFPTYSDSEGSVPRPIPLPAAQAEAVETEMKAEGDALRAQFEKLAGKNGKATFQVMRGNINEILITEARGADLTVIGKKGNKTDSRSHEAGPTTEDVIHEALRPVLVVPEGGTTKGPVLIAFDGSRGVERVVVAGAQMAAARKAPVVVLTVDDNEQEGKYIQQPLRRYLSAYDLKAEFRVEAGEKRGADLILAAARDMKAGMIMMGAFSQNPIKEFFFGSITRTVLHATPCPILMMT